MEKELWEQEKGLFILNEDMNYIIIDGVTETVKHEIKRQEGGFRGASLASLAASLVQPVISSVVKGVHGRGVRGAERGYMDKNF